MREQTMGLNHGIAQHWGSGRNEARRSVRPLRLQVPEEVGGEPLTCCLSGCWRVLPEQRSPGPTEHLIACQCPDSLEFLRRRQVVTEATEDSSACTPRGGAHGVRGCTVVCGGKVVALRPCRIQAISKDRRAGVMVLEARLSVEKLIDTVCPLKSRYLSQSICPLRARVILGKWLDVI